MQNAPFTHEVTNLQPGNPFTALEVESWLEPPSPQQSRQAHSVLPTHELKQTQQDQITSQRVEQGTDATQARSPQPDLPDHPLVSQLRPTTIGTRDLQTYAEQYLQECEMRLQSPRTLETRRLFIRNLLWFLHHRGYRECGTLALRQFFHYLAHGHEEPGGRFGNKHLKRPVRPITIKDYCNCLRPFFEWLVSQQAIEDTPFRVIPQPRVREEAKMPLTPEQVRTLLQAAQKTTNPSRDVAIVSFLLDTGCRASELIAIQLKDVDLNQRSCLVLGKGNKYRTIFFGEKTAEAIAAYLENSSRGGNHAQSPDNQCMPLFLSNAGAKPLTRSGLLQLTRRLSKLSGMKISGSPHAFRRTFAVQTLRNGANVFSVQAMLGHTNLQMTRRYCALAQADVEAQHRQFSPLDRL